MLEVKMKRLNGMMAVGFIVLMVVSICTFGIFSVASAFGYNQGIWPLWYISLFATFGVMLMIIVISALSVWESSRNRLA